MLAAAALVSLCAAVTLVDFLWTPAAPSAAAVASGKLNPDAWPRDALTIANLGHATLLMDYFGVRVISDPTLFNRVGLSLGGIVTIGPRRMVAPPLEPAALQNLDVLLITHAHMDHLDIPSLAALPKTAVVVACTGCGDLIRPLGFKDVRELKWGESTVIDGLSVTALGARHWGKRWPYGHDYGFNSYLLARNGHRMLLACDSAMTSLFAPLAANPPEIAAFSVGAYDPWIWNHANPEQVWRMFTQTGAQYLIPIHWGTFRLSKEPPDEPLRRLIAAAGPNAGRIVMRQIGTAWTLPDDASKHAGADPLLAGQRSPFRENPLTHPRRFGAIFRWAKTDLDKVLP
jgi:L-ascorbate metabolism protein UlaG (beta-lactamase superfamily)